MKNAFILLFALTIVLLSCHHEEPELTYSPKICCFGTSVKVYHHGLDSLNSPLVIYHESIDDYSHVDSIKLDTIYFTIPYGVESSDLIFYNYNSPDSFVLSGLEVEDILSDDIRVAWSMLNYDITNYRATYVKQSTPGTKSLQWNSEVRNDTVEVIGIFHTWEVVLHFHLLFKDHGDDLLPELIDVYTVLYNDFGGPGSIVEFPMNRGLIYIQDWQPGVLVSGRVLSDERNKNNYMFYSNFSDALDN